MEVLTSKDRKNNICKSQKVQLLETSHSPLKNKLQYPFMWDGLWESFLEANVFLSSVFYVLIFPPAFAPFFNLQNCDEKRVWGSIVRIRHRQAVRAVSLTWSREANQITPWKIKNGTPKNWDLEEWFPFQLYGCFFRCHVHFWTFWWTQQNLQKLGKRPFVERELNKIDLAKQGSCDPNIEPAFFRFPFFWVTIPFAGSYVFCVRMRACSAHTCSYCLFTNRKHSMYDLFTFMQANGPYIERLGM